MTRARAENRLLFTRGRRLAARSGDEPVLAVLATESPAEVARELSVRPGIHWLHAPLIRWLVDNARRVPAGAEDLAELPVAARQVGGRIMRCPHCRRVFCPGSHVRRMRA